MYFIANCMMRGAFRASDVTLPKSELFNAATGLFGVILLKTLKTSHRNCICWLPSRNDPRHPSVDVPPPRTQDGVERHRPVGADRRQLERRRIQPLREAPIRHERIVEDLVRALVRRQAGQRAVDTGGHGEIRSRPGAQNSRYLPAAGHARATAPPPAAGIWYTTDVFRLCSGEFGHLPRSASRSPGIIDGTPATPGSLFHRSLMHREMV